MKTIRLSFIALAISAAAYAQPEATMYTLRGVPQFTNYNPAFVPNYKFVFSVGAPSVFASYANNGFSANDALTEQGDSTVVDIAKFQNALAKRNYINVAAEAELLRLGVKMGARLYTNFSVTGKVFTRVMVPKDLTTLFVNGTADFINGTATLAPELEALAYMETALGASYIVNRKLTVGGRVKFLKGLVNGTTNNTALTLSLADNYAMTVRAEVDARTSGIQNFTDDDFDIEKDYKDYLKNNGIALDLGATYKVTDKLTVGASMLDLGGINWRNNNYGYTLSGDSANYTFSGIDLNQLVNNNQDYLQEELDSVAKNFEPRDGVIANYRTPLPTKMYFTAQYDLKHKFSVSGLFFLEKFRSRFNPGFSLALHKEIGRLAGVSVSYTATNRDYSNLGLGFNLNLGFFQFYLTGDNLLQAPLSYVANGGSFKEFAYNLQFFNVRTGLNFVFGRTKEQEKSQRPTYNKRKK
jgi:hypothetical protein